MLQPPPPPVPLWLRLWAWLTVAAALPLAVLGAEVTTKNVGMADRQGVRSPLYLMQRDAEAPGEPVRLLHLLETRQYGLLIEHSHRAAGWLVGVCAIVLCVGMLVGARGWRRSLGFVALTAVGVQGILGIFRVSRISTELAALHGCVAQLVFATLVVVAVLASRTSSLPASAPRSLRVGGLILCGLVYVQIVCGALTRHLFDPLAQRLHVVLAFAVFGITTWILGRLHRRSAEVSNPAARRLSFALAVFIIVQPILGVEAWIRRFGSGTLPDLLPSDPATDLIRSGHHVLGTLIFVTTAALAVLLCRPSAAAVPKVQQLVNAPEEVPTPMPSPSVNVYQLEGSA